VRLGSPGTVVHCKRERFDVYVGRPSKWGNPFSHKVNTQARYRVGSRQEAVDAYRNWLPTQPQLMESLHELAGMTLGCWCSPQLCHGDVLVELANQHAGKEKAPVTM